MDDRKTDQADADVPIVEQATEEADADKETLGPVATEILRAIARWRHVSLESIDSCLELRKRLHFDGKQLSKFESKLLGASLGHANREVAEKTRWSVGENQKYPLPEVGED